MLRKSQNFHWTNTILRTIFFEKSINFPFGVNLYQRVFHIACIIYTIVRVVTKLGHSDIDFSFFFSFFFISIRPTTLIRRRNRFLVIQGVCVTQSRECHTLAYALFQARHRPRRAAAANKSRENRDNACVIAIILGWLALRESSHDYVQLLGKKSASGLLISRWPSLERVGREIEVERNRTIEEERDSIATLIANGGSVYETNASRY